MAVAVSARRIAARMVDRPSREMRVARSGLDRPCVASDSEVGPPGRQRRIFRTAPWCGKRLDAPSARRTRGAIESTNEVHPLPQGECLIPAALARRQCVQSRRRRRPPSATRITRSIGSRAAGCCPASTASAAAPRETRAVFHEGAPQTAAFAVELAMQFGRDIVDGEIASPEIRSTSRGKFAATGRQSAHLAPREP